MKLPQIDAVKKMRELFLERKANLHPSKEMNEIVLSSTIEECDHAYNPNCPKCNEALDKILEQLEPLLNDLVKLEDPSKKEEL